MKKIFTFWEPRDQMPEYIKLCIETWKKYLPDYEVVILDYSNYEDWIGKDCYDKSLITNFSLPKQTHAIRAAVLNKHGGIWMDADTIILSGDVKKLFEYNNEFLIIGKRIAFLSSVKNSTITKDWMEECQKRINNYKKLKNNRESVKELDVWHYLGNGIINDMLNNLDKYKVTILDHSKLFADPEIYFYPKLKTNEAYVRFNFKESHAKYVIDRCKIILLHNSWTPKEYKTMPKEEFLQTNCTLANILSYALYKEESYFMVNFQKILKIEENLQKLKNELEIYELRDLYKQRQNNIIDKLKKEVKSRKLRVCFLVQETQKWNAQYIYDKMVKSDIFEPFVLVTPLKNEMYRNSYQHCVEFFKNCCNNIELGYDEINKNYIDIKEFKPDIIFYQQLYDLHALQNATYASNFAICYYFPYAIGDSPNAPTFHYERFFIALKKYFIFSKQDMEEIIQYNYKDNNFSITGHPKLDIYNNYDNKNNKKNFVIYAPHHSIVATKLWWSTFPWSGKYILEWAKFHPEFKWVFKPHPRLKTSLVQSKIMSEEEIEEYYNEWEKIGTYQNDDYFDIFMNSKCLITDCGSFLTEYLPTEQPVIHLRNPKAQHYTATNKLIMDSYYKAYNTIELEEWLDRILIKQEDPKKSERLDILRTLDINTSASDKIIDEIKIDLNIIL